MPLDFTVKVMLDQMAAQDAPPLSTLPVELFRQGYVAMRSATSERPDVAKVENRAIPGPAGEIPVRVYTPDAQGPLPALVYFHGGGWVIGDLDTHDGISRSFANAARCVVVSVDYRRAPEHKFPAAVDDAFAATEWVAANAAEVGADGARVAVGGESAGANLAAVVSLLARDRGGPAIAYQLLAYPITDHDFDRPSYHENGEGYFLTAEALGWFWDKYTSNETERMDPRTSPFRAVDVSGLPPGMVITPEFDPLRDEGEAYGARLREAKVDFPTRRVDGMIHDFLGMTAVLPQAKQMIDEAAAALRAAFDAR